MQYSALKYNISSLSSNLKWACDNKLCLMASMYPKVNKDKETDVLVFWVFVKSPGSVNSTFHEQSCLSPHVGPAWVLPHSHPAPLALSGNYGWQLCLSGFGSWLTKSASTSRDWVSFEMMCKWWLKQNLYLDLHYLITKFLLVNFPNHGTSFISKS